MEPDPNLKGKKPFQIKILPRNQQCFLFDFEYLTQANFEAKSVYLTQLTQNFGNLKQKLWKNRQSEPKSSKNLVNIA